MGVGSDMGAATRGRDERVDMESGGGVGWTAAARGASLGRVVPGIVLVGDTAASTRNAGRRRGFGCQPSARTGVALY